MGKESNIYLGALYVGQGGKITYIKVYFNNVQDVSYNLEGNRYKNSNRIVLVDVVQCIEFQPAN